MFATVLPDRLARFLDPFFVLRHGKGSGVDKDTIDVCAMQAADWLVGGDGRNDHSENVCPVIGVFLRNLNDSRLFIDNMCELKTLVPKILGTRAGCAVMVKRANTCAGFASRCAAEYAKFIASRAAKCAAECAAESAEYAAKSAKSTAKSAKSTAKSAKSTAKSAAESAEYAARYAAEFAGYAARCAAESARCAVRSAKSAERAAECAMLAAERTAELRKSCIECVESMIAITDVEV